MVKRLIATSWVVLLAATPALAQQTYDPYTEEEVQETVSPEDDEFVDEIQTDTEKAAEEVEEAVVPTEGERAKAAPGDISLMVGLGIANFRGDLNNNASVGPSWDMRASLRNKDYVGGELAYVGSAHGVSDENDDDLGANADGTAITSAGDALVRFNGTKDSFVQPFVAGGLGLFTLNVRDEDTTVDDGTTLSIPVSAGVNVYATERLAFGGRFNYRVLTEVIGNDIPAGDHWNFGLNVGATF
jgi:hypothetical protein